MSLWLNALQLDFCVTELAGVLYLPGLFIYHAEAVDDHNRSRFSLMERRLFMIMSIGAVLTALFGFALLYFNRALLYQGWFQAKLMLLGGMAVYHMRCRHWMQRLAAGNLPDNTRWLRWFNELPTIFLLVIVGLAIVKPF